MNESPVILEPDLGPGEEVLHNLDFSTVLTVVAVDEDSERIRAFWTVPGVPTPDFRVEQEGPIITTYVFLTYDPGLDGQLVVAHVVDEVSFADVEVPFRIQVGGGLE